MDVHWNWWSVLFFWFTVTVIIYVYIISYRLYGVCIFLFVAILTLSYIFVKIKRNRRVQIFKLREFKIQKQKSGGIGFNIEEKQTIPFNLSIGGNIFNFDCDTRFFLSLSWNNTHCWMELIILYFLLYKLYLWFHDLSTSVVKPSKTFS